MTQKYQVLARKYRPQCFSEVAAQEAVVTTLKNALRFGKIAHAYLFSGSRGVGKTTLARLFAKALNCENLSETQEPCNACSSCKEIIAGGALDVIEIDGASNRGIDDIRQINETIGYAPNRGRYKIYIIDEVHMLTKEAFNALLKTLEEPPEKVKFFFATTEPHKILPTIISRCQRFDLGKIPLSQIVAKLEQIASDLSRQVEPEALHQIGELADGSLRDAESLFDQMLCFLEGTITAAAVRQVFGLVATEHFFFLDKAFSECCLSYAFELVEHLSQTGKDLAHFLSQLINHYRLIAICKTLGEQALPPSIAGCYAQSSRLYTQQQSLYILEYLITAETLIQKSLSARVHLETTLLHLIRSKNRVPIEVLVRRLSELEKSFEGQPTTPIIEEVSAPIEVAKVEVAKVSCEPQKPFLQQPAPPELPEKKQPPLAKAKPPESSDTKPIYVSEDKITSSKHISHYDTLLRFTAIELEGSVKN